MIQTFQIIAVLWVFHATAGLSSMPIERIFLQFGCLIKSQCQIFRIKWCLGSVSILLLLALWSCAKVCKWKYFYFWWAAIKFFHLEIGSLWIQSWIICIKKRIERNVNITFCLHSLNTLMDMVASRFRFKLFNLIHGQLCLNFLLNWLSTEQQWLL